MRGDEGVAGREFSSKESPFTNRSRTLAILFPCCTARYGAKRYRMQFSLGCPFLVGCSPIRGFSMSRSRRLFSFFSLLSAAAIVAPPTCFLFLVPSFAVNPNLSNPLAVEEPPPSATSPPSLSTSCNGDLVFVTSISPFISCRMCPKHDALI